MHRFSTTRSVLTASLTLAISASLAGQAAAQPAFTTNAVQDGDYNDGSTWDNGVPSGSGTAAIGGDFTVNSSASGNQAFNILIGDNDSGNSGTLNLTDGTIDTNRTVSVGGFTSGADNNATGNLNVSGGDLSIGTIQPGQGLTFLSVGDTGSSTGNVNISSGSIDAPDRVLIAANSDTTGHVTQTGGDVTTSFVQVGARGTGTYDLSGGTLTQTNDINNRGILIGDFGGNGSSAPTATGTFTQSGGTINAAGTIKVGNAENSTGTYTLSNDASVTSNGFDVAADLQLGFGVAGPNVSGTLNIEGSNVSITSNGFFANPNTTPNAGDEAFINYVLDSGGLSTIDATANGGDSDINGAVFDLDDSATTVNIGDTFTLLEANTIFNFDEASLTASSDADYDLRLDGTAGQGQQLVAVRGVVPEPTSLALLGLGSLSLLTVRRRRRA